MSAGPVFPRLQILIGGTWRDGARGRAVTDPATGAVLATLPEVGPAELAEAAEAAAQGFRVWRATAPAERRRVMLAAVALLRERRHAIARVMTLEQGKPFDQSLLEVDRGCAILEWDANEGVRTYGRIIPAASGMTHAVFRKPIGPVAAFSPWNFPFSAPARKIGGALAAGCSIVLKPSEETPGTAVMLAAAFQDAGLPDGVLNLVFGEPAQVSDHLIRRPEIRMVTFTGSVAVGKQLASLAGSLMKPVIMELGGHAPVIVCADADPARAARLGVTAKSRNAGQVCVAPTRFYVHDAVHDAFVADFVRNAEELRLGNGLARDTQMGPLANARRLEAMEGFVEDASAQGARIVAGGRRLRGEDNGKGNFFPLTVLADVPETARCMREEPFGPLALIVRVSSLDEALEKANALPYALAAYAFTDSARAIARMADELDCGNLAVNHLTASFPETPFGGTKDSGYGREGGTEGLEGYMTAKLVSVATE